MQEARDVMNEDKTNKGRAKESVGWRRKERERNRGTKIAKERKM
jgi:hypothetical protein